MTSRRLFLKGSAAAMFGAGAAPAWLSRAALAASGARGRKKVLVAIFQRGAVDGLNVVAPFGDRRYYELRPTIAVPRPDGTPDSAIDLDGFFGLHPALAPLKPIYDAKRLAVVHAVGSPDPTRSHFDAQDYMESGTPGTKSTAGGWLNRALPTARGAESPLRAVSMGTALPRTLRGANGAVAVSNLNDFQVRDAGSSATFEDMYRSTADRALNGAGRETFEAVRMMRAVQGQGYSPAAGAEYTRSRFGRSLMQIAQLIKADVGLEVAFADVGGWDTHVNEVGAKASVGQLPNLLADFGRNLAAFDADLGERMADVAVATMSEFGRTARENGNRGTDHGHANMMFVVGGGVRGGKVYGPWPGLEREQLYEGRDLNLTTDFRDVLGELAVKHLGSRDVAEVFPGYRPKAFRGLLAGV